MKLINLNKINKILACSIVLTNISTSAIAYEYKIQKWENTNQQTLDLRFISPSTTQSNVKNGYKIPESFTFDGQELKGYWVSKYRIQDSPADTSAFNGSYYK